MWKNIVMLVRPQMTVWHMAHFTLVPKATNTHTLKICNTNCFSSATMVALMHPSVTVCGLSCQICEARFCYSILHYSFAYHSQQNTAQGRTV